MERSSPQAIYDLLKEWGIDFKSMAHPEAATMEDCKAICCLEVPHRGLAGQGERLFGMR